MTDSWGEIPSSPPPDRFGQWVYDEDGRLVWQVITNPRPSALAISALVLGIAGVFCAGFICGPLAVVFGFLGRRDIRQSNGWITGDGIALAGIILGVIGTIIWIPFAIYVLMNTNNFFATDISPTTIEPINRT